MREVAPATGFPGGEAARRGLAGSALRAPGLPTPSCRPPVAPQAVPGAGFAATPHPEHRSSPQRAGHPAPPATPQPGASRLPWRPHLRPPAPSGSRAGAGSPLGVRLIPPRPAYLGGQAAGAAGSRRRCEQEARGGSAAPLHGGSSPALRLWRSGAAPRAAGRPEAATSAGAAPVHAAPPSASGPGAAAPQSPGGRPAPPSREGPSAGAGGAGPAPCDRFPSRGRAARGRPEGCEGTPAAHKMEPEAHPAKAGGPGRESAALRGEPPASRGSPAQPCLLRSAPAASPGSPQLGRVAFGWATLSDALWFSDKNVYLSPLHLETLHLF